MAVWRKLPVTFQLPDLIEALNQALRVIVRELLLAFPLSAKAIWDPANVANGAMTSTTLTVPAARLLMVAKASFSLALPLGAFLFADVIDNAGSVRVTLWNQTGAPLDLASGTVRVNVWQ